MLNLLLCLSLLSPNQENLKGPKKLKSQSLKKGKQKIDLGFYYVIGNLTTNSCGLKDFDKLRNIWEFAKYRGDYILRSEQGRVGKGRYDSKREYYLLKHTIKFKEQGCKVVTRVSIMLFGVGGYFMGNNLITIKTCTGKCQIGWEIYGQKLEEIIDE